MPDAAVLATMLLLLGLFLLGLEFFVPSFGMILTVAIISLIVSFWCACKAWWGTNPGFFWTYIVLLVTGIPGSLLGAIAIMQKTSLGNRLILRPPPATQEKPFNPLDELIGKEGVAQTLLTPGGMVSIDNQRFHAESIGILIEPRTPVIVVAVRANRIVVKPASLISKDAPGAASGNAFVRAGQMKPDPGDKTKNHPGSTAKKLNAQNENHDRLDFEIPDDYTEAKND